MSLKLHALLLAAMVASVSFGNCNPLLAVVARGGHGIGFDRHIGQTTQTSLESFPPVVQDQLRKIIAATDKTGWEHAAMVLQVGDKFLVATAPEGKIATSKSDSVVNAADHLSLVVSLLEQIKDLPQEDRMKPIKIFDFHTHPEKTPAPGSFARRPIHRDEKGNAYTYVSVPHDFKAQDALLASLAVALRQQGFTGKMGGSSGPVPANIDKNANPYVALHQADLTVGEGSKPVFQAFKIPADNKSVPIVGGAATFSTEGTAAKIFIPGTEKETIGTLYRSSSGWGIRPNSLSSVTMRVNGAEVPATGVDLRKSDIVSIGGSHFIVE